VSAWRCDLCHRPIRRGYVEILAASEDGVVGGYPEVPTPDEELPEAPGGRPGRFRVVSAAELLVLGETQRRIAFRVVHDACDEMHRPGYAIEVGRARALAQWVEWVVHVAEKGWMGRRDLVAMLELWFRNRGQERPYR